MENTTASMVVQLGLALICVVGAIFVLAWITKKLNIGHVGQQKNMRVLGVLPLGTREKAILIEVSGKQMLLGVAPGRVNTLANFSSKESADGDEDALPTVSEQKITQNLGARTVSEFSKKLQACLLSNPAKSKVKSGKTHDQ